jgi:hypothetical protein
MPPGTAAGVGSTWAADTARRPIRPDDAGGHRAARCDLWDKVNFLPISGTFAACLASVGHFTHRSVFVTPLPVIPGNLLKVGARHPLDDHGTTSRHLRREMRASTGKGTGLNAHLDR